MLEGGYTSACEFHYLHNDIDGRPYADDATLAAVPRARGRSAPASGLTLLPVLYQQGGFGGVAPTDGQRRFVRSTDSLLRLVKRMRPMCAGANARVGLAVHSLRAVTPDALRDVLVGSRHRPDGADRTSTWPNSSAKWRNAWRGAASGRWSGC